MSERITIFATVLLPLPLPKLYTYRVPFEWNEFIVPGLRVAVGFGVKKVYSGIVWELSEQPPVGYQASYILEILDEQPIVSAKQMQFWNWISQYYMSFLGDVLSVALPAGYRVQSTTKITLHPEFQPDDLPVLDEKENQILALLIQEKTITVDQVQQLLNQKSVMKHIKSMYMKGVLSMHEELRENYKPKIVEMLEFSALWDDADEANLLLNSLEKKAPKQFTAMMHLLGKGRKLMELKSALEGTDIGRETLRQLEKKGAIHLFKQRTENLIIGESLGEKLHLTPAQEIASQEIEKGFNENKHVLLYGVTGSGKTLLYLEFAEKMVQQGKQVLFLVPEVALTENLVDRVRKNISVEVGVWHHYYSTSERTELYEKVRKREINFVIGTRSALFAPFVELGLIVVDEEHEPGYKQFEKRPLFHARDAAFYLAKQHQAHVLMGSATPSYEMWHLAEKRQIHKVVLKQRFEQRDFAMWQWLNIKELKKQNRMVGLFSDPMIETLTESLSKKHKIIVYHNRKGYAPYIQCSLCGHTTDCIQCDISLTYYKSSNNQRCGYCGFQQSLPKVCPGCGGNDFTMKGSGTEKMVEELGILFPTARIARFDQQSIKKRSDFQKIINDFHHGNIDILVGTQLLAKGIDFEDVSLIAVPDGDISLNIPDFRSNERAFQQLYQLAGRAGRGKVYGQIVVQTYKTEHPVFEFLQADDYEGLAEQELESRKTFEYPPFGRLIEIYVRHKEEQSAITAAMVFNNLLRPVVGERLLGPITPSVSKIKNQYIQQFLIKFDSEKYNAAKVKVFLLQQKDRLLQMDGMNGVVVDFVVDP